MKAVFIALLCGLAMTAPVPSAAGSLDVQGALNSLQGEYENSKKQRDLQRKQNAQEAARKAKENAANRDRSKDVCYQMESGSDAQTACLGEHVYAIRDKRAQNIMLGHCYSLGASSDFNSDLSYVCSEGKRGCSILDDGEASYWCGECGGTRRWLAVYSLGTIIQCFKR